MIQFFVKGIPVPQARPRTFLHRISGRYVTMNPKKTEAWKRSVYAQAFQYRPRMPADGPVHLSLEFYLPKLRSDGGRAGTWARQRPDLDNLMKAVMDALMTAGFFKDDALVVSLEASKRYAMDTSCGVLVAMTEMKEAT
jgi:Holliday junction resolvase RusA-like endonuclease